MSDSESDIELKSALPTKIPQKKAPRSPSEDLKTKKITTKLMIVDALTELKTRKGVSLYAIKKYLTEKYNVNTEKVNYLIKKSIKAGVEDGTFIQMKGIGASGSFKLANVKEKPKAKKKPKKPEKIAKPEKPATKTEKKESKTEKINEVKKPKKMETKKKEKTEGKTTKKKVAVENPEKTREEKVKTKSKVKIAKGLLTPTKKRAALIKRKSIGSIIKPPKMKPT